MPLKDKQARREYAQKWRGENPEKVQEIKHADYKKHQGKRDKATNSYREQRPWLRHFVNAKQRCTNKKCPSYKYYGAKGVKFELTLEEVKELWFRDKAFDLIQASLDRKESNEPYCFDNCRFVERNVNCSKKVDSKLE